MGLSESGRLRCEELATELGIDAMPILKAARSQPQGVRRMELLLHRLEHQLGSQTALKTYLAATHPALRVAPIEALRAGRLLAVELLEYQMSVGAPSPSREHLLPSTLSPAAAEPVQLSIEPRLSVDLIPQTSFFRNVRSHTTREQWQAIRQVIIGGAQGRCQICNASSVAMDCHEQWSYDGGIQRLTGLVALCKRCHEVKHFKLAELRGHGLRALRHLCGTNGWTQDQAFHHIAEAYAVWEERSRTEWRLDLSFLMMIARS